MEKYHKNNFLFYFLHIHALFIIIILVYFVLGFVVICLFPNKIYKNSLNLFAYTPILLEGNR
jgi:hypothetical protein